MSREGFSPIHRATSGMDWHGLSLGQSSTNTGSVGVNPVAWDVLYTQTDAIRSVGTETPGIYSIPAGAAGIVPAGMAGRWRVGGNMDLYPAGSGLFTFGIILNDAGVWFIEDDLQISGTPPDDVNLTISPVVRVFAEGDILWTWVVLPDTSTLFGGPDASFLMEYLGPA